MEGLLQDELGLSPRMRGSLAGAGFRGMAQGPIPAYAGEPYDDALRERPRRAYPRVCGGASLCEKNNRHG